MVNQLLMRLPINIPQEFYSIFVEISSARGIPISLAQLNTIWIIFMYLPNMCVGQLC